MGPIFGQLATSGGGDAAVAIIPATPGVLITSGTLWTPDSPAPGQWSIDNGLTWFPFEKGPFDLDLPPGFYVFGLLVRRVPAGADVTNVKALLYPQVGAIR